jgi:hypothetical protein
VPDSTITHITLVLDRSGSMHSVRDDAIGGFNAFVEQQRRLPGHATLTLIQFDDVFCEMYRAKPIGEVPFLDADTFVPRGSTALYDALGRAVADTLEYVRDLDEGQRPAHVIVAILTDGQENASKEYTHQRVRSIVNEANAKPNWQVLFLASSLAVVEDARQLGVSRQTSMAFNASRKGTRIAFGQISGRVTDVRCRASSEKSDDDNDDDPGPILH